MSKSLYESVHHPTSITKQSKHHSTTTASKTHKSSIKSTPTVIHHQLLRTPASHSIHTPTFQPSLPTTTSAIYPMVLSLTNNSNYSNTNISLSRNSSSSSSSSSSISSSSIISSSISSSSISSSSISSSSISSSTISSSIISSSSNQTLDPVNFVAPILGAIAGLGILAFIALYCIQHINKPKIADARWGPLEEQEEEEMGGGPPPVYTAMAMPTPAKKEKRWTEQSNLVDSMLKSQYSPQLAFSPSLVAGEFKQDVAPPVPPVPTLLSPSHTLVNPISHFDGKSQFDTYQPQLQQKEDEEEQDTHLPTPKQ